MGRPSTLGPRLLALLRTFDRLYWLDDWWDGKCGRASGTGEVGGWKVRLKRCLDRSLLRLRDEALVDAASKLSVSVVGWEGLVSLEECWDAPSVVAAPIPKKDRLMRFLS